MAYLPGGLTFPTGSSDSGEAAVAEAYWIADTEVTYELWDKVHSWALGNSYSFANVGTMGDGSGDSDQHPVTTVNWRDSMVWCNALTEWYNSQKGTTYSCVYSYSGAIIRDSRDPNAEACDNAVVSSTSDGFRLLTGNEWECAARYRDGSNWTYGDHVSGDETGACYDDGSILGGLGISTVFGDYAVYNVNSGGTAAAVKSKTANALGLYDMSGNVYEWCFNKPSVSRRTIKGGSWYNVDFEQTIGGYASYETDTEHDTVGFRFARTQ